MSIQIITTVTAPAQPPSPNPNDAGAYDLTDLATLHDELNIAATDTSNDPFLARAITQASTAIATYCNRVFPVEGLSDLCYIQQDPYPYQTPGGVAPLQLSRFPVTNVLTLPLSATVEGGSSVLPFGSSTSFPAWVVEGVPVSGLNVPPGVTVKGTSDGNLTISADLSAETTQGTLITIGLSAAQTITEGTLEAMVLDQDYTLDPNTGQLIRLDPFTGVGTIWEALPVTVSYFAGYGTIPADIEDACLRLVTWRFYARGRDPSLREQEQPGSLGRRVFWIGGPPKSGGLPEEVTGLIDRYRTPMAL